MLDLGGYIQKKDGFPIKFHLAPRKIRVTDVLTGKKKDLMVDEKQVVFCSPAYAQKAKMEWEEVLKKEKSMIFEPQKYTRSTSYGAAKYMKPLSFDKEIGEILTHMEKARTLGKIKSSGRCKKRRKNTTINAKIEEAVTNGFSVGCCQKRTLVLQKSGACMV